MLSVRHLAYEPDVLCTMFGELAEELDPLLQAASEIVYLRRVVCEIVYIEGVYFKNWMYNVYFSEPVDYSTFLITLTEISDIYDKSFYSIGFSLETVDEEGNLCNGFTVRQHRDAMSR